MDGCRRLERERERKKERGWDLREREGRRGEAFGGW